jgi:rfaE bifunctional protein kinase chain/domain/rfaE bifunctional protein nucleotidyltransferase chain/domain
VSSKRNPLSTNAGASGREKIKKLDELAALLLELKAQGKRVVHCHGVFDLLHVGHIRHLEEARKQGDILVVTLTQDRYVNKGPTRPAFPQGLRAEAIAALAVVDFAAVNRWPQADKTIRLLKPDVYVKGPDYKELEKDISGGITAEIKAIESVGGRIYFTKDITFSSSNLINRHLPVFSREVGDYLREFGAKYPAHTVLNYLENAKSLKILVVGEAIIDEYQYCETMGKSGKEPVLAARHLSTVRSIGGVLSVANHIASFSDHVSVLTFLGREESEEDFIREKLDPRIETVFLYMEDAPTILKRRFVESYPFQKLFEVYRMGDDNENSTHTDRLCATLADRLPQYDLVVVTDYGHGMIAPRAVESLCRNARFLAVNPQVNAGNQGYNTVSKYYRADYVSVSENEIRLDAQSRQRNIRDIMLEVAEKLDCRYLTVTSGEQGCLVYARDEGIYEVPAFASRVVDRVGAGDTLFALVSLCAVQNAPAEVAGFVGNVGGAEAVMIVGNQSLIQRIPLMKHIEALLQ